MTDDRQSAAARNRALMPSLFAFADEVREAFGSVKVVRASNGVDTLGSEPVYSGTWLSTADMPSLDEASKEE